ncbi:MAG TPA: DNA-formamidopyrimidine glycosylase family protein, partial [Spirochaetia bacterium]|nr:DNA-formamidopyrimidine glycosylase family protein [Spirochaetia bacterium]
SALNERLRGTKLDSWHFLHPFLLRTVEPDSTQFVGRKVVTASRIGKRIVLEFEGNLYAAIHLMIAGRLHWKEGTSTRAAVAQQRGPTASATRQVSPPRRSGRNAGPLFLADFGSGTLTLTEAGTKRRASIHLIEGRSGIEALDPGGLELFVCDAGEFAQRLRKTNHTLKRALTDPKLFSGIGNAYSDEILHAAGLSPFLLTGRMSDADALRLFETAKSVLSGWKDLLEAQRKGAFPQRVTAFHPGMAVHGRFGKPCPICGTSVLRIRYADNESNYCPRCQTGGVVYADRALSRLLKNDWPRTVEELENLPGFR